jgi:hypothetical protein
MLLGAIIGVCSMLFFYYMLCMAIGLVTGVCSTIFYKKYTTNIHKDVSNSTHPLSLRT